MLTEGRGWGQYHIATIISQRNKYYSLYNKKLLFTVEVKIKPVTHAHENACQALLESEFG